MARLIFILYILINTLNADIYKQNCLKCHNKIPVSIDKYFYRYLLKYSSEKNVKFAMTKYLKKPIKELTIMPKAFTKRFGIKKRTKLTDKQLKEAFNIYWEKYKVFGKLK